jgi:hypothetical protein
MEDTGCACGCAAFATGDRPSIDRAALAESAGALTGFSLRRAALSRVQLEK